MSEFEIEEALQLRNQRFIAALHFSTTECVEREGARMECPSFNEAIDMADQLIAMLEEPTR